MRLLSPLGPSGDPRGPSRHYFAAAPTQCPRAARKRCTFLHRDPTNQGYVVVSKIDFHKHSLENAKQHPEAKRAAMPNGQTTRVARSITSCTEFNYIGKLEASR